MAQMWQQLLKTLLLPDGLTVLTCPDSNPPEALSSSKTWRAVYKIFASLEYKIQAMQEALAAELYSNIAVL